MTPDKTTDDEVVSTVIRFHDPKHMGSLSVALMSLAGQTYNRVEPIIVLQDFADEDASNVRTLSEQIPWPRTFEKPNVVNVTGLGPGDHRAQLANAGISGRTGRFLCFLDYDDQLYGDCYKTLHRQISKTKKTVSFVGVISVDYDPTPRGNYVLKKFKVFQDKRKYEFFVENQHPIHSFMIDTMLVDEVLLNFDEGNSRNEDYAFLLRILAKHDWDQSMTKLCLAEYSMSVTGSNTIMAHSHRNEAKQKAWDEAIEYVEQLKSGLNVTLPCTELIDLVQRSRSSYLETDGNNKGPFSVNSHLARSLYYLTENNIRRSPHAHIDDIQKRHDGTYSISGWFASPDRLPVEMVIVVDRSDKQSELFVCGPCNRDRMDVGSHLRTDQTRYGFDLRTLEPPANSENLLLIGITNNGRSHYLAKRTFTNKLLAAIKEIFARLKEDFDRRRRNAG